MFTMRFDLRARDGFETLPALYETALEMAAWGEDKGCVAIQVSEHHASSDGYLPAPLLMASAVAARTKTTPIQVAALLVPLHDPVSLAERMAVLDHLSRGRVSYVCAIGYRAEEYAMFGQEMGQRGKRMEECLEVFRQAWSGDRFEYQGRVVQVTPMPMTQGGPVLMMGGNSKAAVRRAARFQMGMMTQGGNPELETVYREACREFGTEPQAFFNPSEGTPASCFVAEDIEGAWAKLGPYMLHDAEMYAAWMAGGQAITKSAASSVAALRAEAGNYRIFTPEQAVAHIRANGVLMTQPLSGGIPPELAWQSLELIAKRVVPALRAA